MITTKELENFVSFARTQIDGGRAESLAQLLSQWEAQREYQEAVADIQTGLAEVEAGKVFTTDEVLAEIRTKLGLDV